MDAALAPKTLDPSHVGLGVARHAAPNEPSEYGGVRYSGYRFEAIAWIPIFGRQCSGCVWLP